MSDTVELEEDKEELVGTVLWGGSDEVIIMPVFYPHGPFSIS